MLLFSLLSNLLLLSLHDNTCARMSGGWIQYNYVYVREAASIRIIITLRYYYHTMVW